MADNRGVEAAEKLQRGIEESRQRIRRQAMELAQEFFGDSVEGLKDKVQESRATLEGLPDQIPGGQEESFQMLFQELMENYAAIEKALDEARENVANLDTEEMRRQEGFDASEAAKREARELGVDIAEVEGLGSGGRVIVSDVVEVAKNAAKRKADELGVDLSQVEGTGPGGLVLARDVESFAAGAADGEPEAAGETTGGTGQRAGEIVVDAAGMIIEADGGADSDGAGEPLVTGAARRRAERLGVDLTTVKGTGAGGLITLRDVMVP